VQGKRQLHTDERLSSHPFNPGNPLGYNPTTTKFALYDANDSLREICLTTTGTLSKTGTISATSLNWILSTFNTAEGRSTRSGPAGRELPIDYRNGATDRIFTATLGN